MKEKIKIGTYEGQKIHLLENGSILIGDTVIKDQTKNKWVKKLYKFTLEDLQKLKIKPRDISGKKFNRPYDIRFFVLEECRKYNLKSKKHCIPCQKIKNWWYMNRIYEDRYKIISRVENRLWRIQKKQQ